MSSMPAILFLTSFFNFSGGQVKVRDYFQHCLEHPSLEPYLYFTPKFHERYAGTDVWRDIPEERIVPEVALERCRAIFVTAKDWKYLPKHVPLDGKVVINFHQSLNEVQPDRRAFRYLSKTAVRVCTSGEVFAAIAPHAKGVATVVLPGIPLELFGQGGPRRDGSVLIWGRKHPHLAQRLHDELAARGRGVTLRITNASREEFAGLLREHDVFVGLTLEREGFYLPALEAMASGCAVVCDDAMGNRGYCIDGETCLLVQREDFDGHVAAVERLLADSELRGRLRRQGCDVAERYSLGREREDFYRVLDEHVLAGCA
jgi:glycosyltransferase involved in cell wall biosynthesis